MSEPDPDPDVVKRHARKLPPIFEILVWELDRIHGADYAGTTSGGALSTTGGKGESRAPGRLSQRGPVVALERDFNASEDPHSRLRVIFAAEAELKRLRPRRRAIANDAPAYRTSPSGRPRSTTDDEDRELRARIVARAEERSGVAFATLLETVGPGRKAHADLVASVLAEHDAGAPLATLRRALPELSKSTLIRWAK